MKKLLLFVAFALLFTIFSCTPDEYETQSKKKVENVVADMKPDPDPDGPGDNPSSPPTPPIKP
ncbi:hypothetical protein [Flavobacterium ustbae]|uniref:hypothetical protein n=1 Tax=Flavobacterium ustbae TaxID=2488790 RepID=UPI000F7A90E5|nr:hypothetical protein [Flavobacterium ustbae]